MASYLDKAQVNTAITDNTKLDLGHQMITTADFMQLNVAYMQELVPGSKIDVNMESFARLNPLPVPTFGRASMRNRAYFVPFRTIFRGWNDFITDSVHVSSDGLVNTGSNLLTRVPTVDMSVLTGVFTEHVVETPEGNGLLYPVGQGGAYDIYLSGTSGGNFNFTIRGRQAIKVLESLGYKLDWDAKAGECVLSALPLLALAKVYCDWYYPQQYSNMTNYDQLLSMCNYDVMAGPLQMTTYHLYLILMYCVWSQYDSDYFVSAWDQPNSPGQGNYSDFKLVNIDSVSKWFDEGNSRNVDAQGSVSNYSGPTLAWNGNTIGGANAPFIAPGVINNANSRDGQTIISEYLLHALHAMTDYMKRHQLAGSRAFDRYLARFGKALPAEKINRSNYLGAAVQDIQIGDVMSTSDTVKDGLGSQLGSFAGKGISYGNGHFDFSTDEYGYFIIVSSIVPATSYFQGIDRQVMRTTKLSFWTPEFDSLGVQPITAAELFVPQSSGEMAGNKYQQIFGFAPRYADYKSPTCLDRITGNFRLRSLNGGPIVNAADSWHLARVFEANGDFSSNYENVVHSVNFINGMYDFSQYKRIFYDQEADAPDNFTVIHNFEVAEYAPMKALYDTYEFEDKGKKVTLETNGVKHN